MNKKMTKLLTVTLVVVMMLALAVPVFAETATDYENGSKPTVDIDATGKVQFDKVFTVKQNAVVPELTFTFVLTAETAPSVGNWVSRTSQVTSAITAAAANSATSYSTDVSGLGVADSKGTLTVKYSAITEATTEDKELRKGFVLDFNGIIKNSLKQTPAEPDPTPDGYVTEPGVYRYKVVEDPQNDSRIDYTNTNGYYIDIFVQWGSNEQGKDWLEIANIVVIPISSTGTAGGYTEYKYDEGTDTEIEDDEDWPKYDNATKVDGTPETTTDGSGTTKSSGSDATFEQKWKTYSLSVTKTVTGNQGSKTEEFTFTISGIGSVPNGTYGITYKGGSITTNPTSVTITNNAVSATDKDESATTLVIKLTHGMSFTIDGLPYGAVCIVAETEATGYTTTYQLNDYGTPADGLTCDLTVYENGLDQDITVHYVNNKEGTIPTGVLLTIAPFAALMLIGLVGITVVVLKKKHD